MPGSSSTTAGFFPAILASVMLISCNYFQSYHQYAVPSGMIASMSFFEIKSLQVLNLAPWSCELAEGECITLGGASGSGKTRLLRAIADLDPHQGECLLAGKNCSSMAGHEWRRQVGYLTAESQWWHPLVGAHFEDADTGLLKQLGFDESVMGWRIERLSSGEKQRLALVRMLQQNPGVLLLDEPTANLDRDCTRVIEKIVAQQQQQGKAVIWVSHNQQQSLRVSDRYWQIASGRLEESVS